MFLNNNDKNNTSYSKKEKRTTKIRAVKVIATL